MPSDRRHLAQINIAFLREPLDHPSQTEFVDLFDAINAVADADPDFVWRLKSDDGGASSYVQAFDDPAKIVNLTVWRSVEALHRYVYRSSHREVLARAREWLSPHDGPTTALWWTEAGTPPSVEEGVARLEHLQAHGPSPYAFTFAVRFGPEAAAGPLGGVRA